MSLFQTFPLKILPAYTCTRAITTPQPDGPASSRGRVWTRPRSRPYSQPSPPRQTTTKRVLALLKILFKIFSLNSSYLSTTPIHSTKLSHRQTPPYQPCRQPSRSSSSLVQSNNFWYIFIFCLESDQPLPVTCVDSESPTNNQSYFAWFTSTRNVNHPPKCR